MIGSYLVKLLAATLAAITPLGFATPALAQRADEWDACQLIRQLDTVRGLTAVRDRVFRSRDSLVIVRGDCDEPLGGPFRAWPTIIQLSPLSPSARSSVGELLERLQRASTTGAMLRVEATFVGSVEAVDAAIEPEGSGFGPEGKYPVRMSLYDVEDVTVSPEPVPEDLQQVAVCEALKQQDLYQGKRIALRGISQSIRGSHALCTPCDQPIQIEEMSFPPCVIVDYSVWRTKMEVPGLEAGFVNEERTTTGRRDATVEVTYVGVFNVLNPHASTIRGFGMSGMEFPAKLYYETYRDAVTLTGHPAEEWTTKPYPPLASPSPKRPKRCQQLKLLTELAAEGCPEEVKEAIRSGADVNAPDADGNSPLWHAVRWSHADVVEILLAAGADVNHTRLGWTPLCNSATSAKTHTTRLLLDYGAEVNQTSEIKCNALAEAARAGHPETIMLLLSAGANIEARNQWNWTPLQASVFKNRPENVRVLLSSGADPDVRDQHGKSPLMLYYRTPALARALIDSGADVDAADGEGITVLMQASRDALPRIVERLIAAGADVNRRDRLGNTALFYAVEGACVSCIRYLRLAGADLTTTNNTGKTVFDLIPQEVTPAIRHALESKR